MKKSFLLSFAVAVMMSACTEKVEKFSDIDGNEYGVLNYGPAGRVAQTWSAENYKCVTFNDGTPMHYAPTDSAWAAADSLKIPAWCVYGVTGSNDEALASENFRKYGVLYNQYAVSAPGFCPEGWHVATRTDFDMLRKYLVDAGMNYDGTPDGNKIAKAMTDGKYWTSNTDDEPGDIGSIESYPNKNNISGFSAMPGGDRRLSGAFMFEGEQGFFWTSTMLSTGEAYFSYSLSNTECDLAMNTLVGGYGFSVRLVKD